MNYQTSFTVESKTPGFEGVKFTIRRVSEGLRRRIALDVAAPRARVREILSDTEDLWAGDPVLARQRLLGSQIPEGSTESTPEEQHQAMKRLQILRGFQERMEDVTAEIDLAWLRACLLKIEGLEIDGEPAVVDTFVELGPIELYREAVQLVKSEADPTEEETNLEAVNL